MNIQLRNIGAEGQQFLRDKIVHVRVLERRDAGGAIIELNGLKIEAQIEADVPDNFLALVETSGDGNAGRTVRLRILSSFKSSPEFGELSRLKLVESVRMFLLENSLPLTDETVASALLARSAGLKLDAGIVKILNLADRKGGNSLRDAAILFLKSGIRIDAEFLDVFAAWKAILKKSAPASRSRIDAVEPDNEGETEDRTFRALNSLAGKYFGDGSAYRAFTARENGDDVIVQQRREKTETGERYYFDLTSRRTGPVLLVLDADRQSYRAAVYIDPETYEEERNKIEKGRDALIGRLRSLAGMRQVTVSFGPLENELAFWTSGSGRDNPQDGAPEAIQNLDISV